MEDKEERRFKILGFEGFMEWIWMVEDEVVESETARTMDRSRAERGGSHRSASMELDCGRWWIWRVSDGGFWDIVRVLRDGREWEFVLKKI